MSPSISIGPPSPPGVLDLTVQQETQGTWKASITLLCTYEPSADFKQEIVIWKINQPEYGFRTLFHWDTNSGGQALLSNFKGRTRFPNHPPGDVSLSVADLEMADSGQYSCEVTWEARNKSRITKSKTTTLRVLKGNFMNVSPGRKNVLQSWMQPKCLVAYVHLLHSFVFDLRLPALIFFGKMDDNRSEQRGWGMALKLFFTMGSRNLIFSWIPDVFRAGFDIYLFIYFKFLLIFPGTYTPTLKAK